MPYYALIYHTCEDYVARRAPYREEHLALARAARQRGELLMGGAFTDPVDIGLLLWKADDRSVVQRFVDQDPYVRAGLIERYEIREWVVVVGGDGA